MTIAERIHAAKKIIYEFQLWPAEAIVCNADEFTFKIRYDRLELKHEWLTENYPDKCCHHSDIDDHAVITDTLFLKDQFNKYIYLAEEIPEL